VARNCALLRSKSRLRPFSWGAVGRLLLCIAVCCNMEQCGAVRCSVIYMYIYTCDIHIHIYMYVCIYIAVSYSACPDVMYELPILCTPALQVKTSFILMVCSRSRHVLQHTATHRSTLQHTSVRWPIGAAKWRHY